MMEDEPDVLEMLIEHELAVKRLYLTYAAVFADHRDFWQALAGEEQGHADRLEELRSLPNVDDRPWHDSGLRPQAIKSSIGYVDGQTVRAQEGRLSLMQALSIGKDLENALIEDHFSKLTDLVPAEIRSVLEDLAADTVRHRKTLADALDAERRLRL